RSDLLGDYRCEVRYVPKDNELRFDLLLRREKGTDKHVGSWPLEDFGQILSKSWKAAYQMEDGRFRTASGFRQLVACRRLSARRLAILEEMRQEDEWRRNTRDVITVWLCGVAI